MVAIALELTEPVEGLVSVADNLIPEAAPETLSWLGIPETKAEVIGIVGLLGNGPNEVFAKQLSSLGIEEEQSAVAQNSPIMFVRAALYGDEPATLVRLALWLKHYSPLALSEEIAAELDHFVVQDEILSL